ncbi:MAG: hypothetical protein R6U96_15215 [Promethearchaeia archaeon]
MNPSKKKENESEIVKLTNILSVLQDLYYKKKDQLEDLKDEIERIKEVIQDLKSVISPKSFVSADTMIKKEKEKPKQEENVDEYFKEGLQKEKAQGTNIKRKIFSSETKQDRKLLCILNFPNFSKVTVKILHPELTPIEESSEPFVKIFLKGALVKIKETNPELDIKYHYYKETDLIQRIEILNVKNVEEYDLITSQVQDLLLEVQKSEKP